MERRLQEHLMATNDEFRRLVSEHAGFARRLDELASRSYLSEQEQLEEVRLKKLKLRLKDQMQVIIQRESSRQVA